VDVKISVSPVAAFLREEVCAVSDHLAAVSLFDSEEWMASLQHFSGWTDTSPSSQGNLRLLVSRLHLRPLAEHGDVESPLLRSQIDDQFLRAMSAARSQMEIGTEQDRPKHSGKITATRPPHQPRGYGTHQHGLDSFPPQMHSVPNHVSGQARATGMRRPRYPYPPLQWWGQGWHQGHHYPFPDDTSVHSSLSGGDAFSEYGVYAGAAGPNGAYYAPAYHHPHGYDHSQVQGVFDPNMTGDLAMYHMQTPYHPEHAGLGFYGHPPVDPSVAYATQQHDEMATYYGVNATPMSPHHSSPAGSQHISGDTANQAVSGSSALAQTPYKNDSKKTPRSPYWGHLDATIAMGLSTPQTNFKESSHTLMSPEEDGDGGAQPLLLRQSQFYGYGPVNNVSQRIASASISEVIRIVVLTSFSCPAVRPSFSGNSVPDVSSG
jgi:hypothetical protein